MHGRRSFLKKLGAAIGTVVVASKIPAAEKAQAKQYPETFKKNSLPKNQAQNIYGTSGNFQCSGCYSITGSYLPGQFITFSG